MLICSAVIQPALWRGKSPDSWDTALRQSILLNNTGTSANDKRKVLETLNAYSAGFPVSLRPLMTLWRDQLKQAIALSDERQRYRRLQSDTDGKIDQLRAVNSRLQFELQNTTRKLDNLSNIERQLAGRKQPTKADAELENALEERREALEEAAGTAEPKPAEAKPADVKPAEAKPAAAETKAAETKPAQEKRSNPGMTARRSANLLLVDDDPGLLKLLGMRLSSEGFQVSTAESGPEALKVLNKEKIDLVISDLRMDEMDGMALFAEIQKTHSGMPVIILTAHGSIPDAVAATREGVFSFLTKPVDRDALYKAIDDALALSTTTVSDESWCEGCDPQPADAASA